MTTKNIKKYRTTTTTTATTKKEKRNETRPSTADRSQCVQFFIFFWFLGSIKYFFFVPGNPMNIPVRPVFIFNYLLFRNGFRRRFYFDPFSIECCRVLRSFIWFSLVITRFYWVFTGFVPEFYHFSSIQSNL